MAASYSCCGRSLPEHATAVSLVDRLLHHSIVVVTEVAEQALINPEGGDFESATSRDHDLAVDNPSQFRFIAQSPELEYSVKGRIAAVLVAFGGRWLGDST